jgi:P4 family phage/plasmid primase-like protien
VNSWVNEGKTLNEVLAIVDLNTEEYNRDALRDYATRLYPESVATSKKRNREVARDTVSKLVTEAAEESAVMGPHAALFRQVTETLNSTAWDELTFFESEAVHVLTECAKPYILHDGSSWQVYNEPIGIFEPEPHTVYQLVGRVAAAWLDGIGGLKARSVDFSFLKSIDSDKGRRAVMNGLSHTPGIYCKPTEFDTDPYMLNCQGVVYNLRDGRSRPATPDDRFTQTTNYKPAEGKTPKWDKFLDDFTCGDSELKRYLLRYFGQGLTGIITQRQFIYMHGGGQNGKSKLLDIIGGMMGGYYGTANPELFSKQYNSGGKDAQYFYPLVGKRLVTCADVPQGTLNISAIKQITGGDGVTIKKLFADEVNNVHLKCKLIMSSQHKLRLTEFTDALSSRLRLVLCQQRVDEEKKDTHIVEKVLSEAPSILAALIREAVEFCRDDRELPCEAITRESREYQKSEDALGMFLVETFEFRSTINRAELFSLYKEWGGKTGRNRFFTEVELRGYKNIHTENGDVFENPAEVIPETDNYLPFPIKYPYTRDNENLYGNDKKLSAEPVPDTPPPKENIAYVSPEQQALWEHGEVY